MKGQKPAPARLVAVMGNPGRRPIKQGTSGTDKIGAAPRGMSDAAKLKWAEASAEWKLVLTGADRDALRMYCEAWAEMMNALDRVREDGAMILTPSGMVQKSPWMTKVEQSRDFCRKMLTDFGASPSARSGIKSTDEENEDPLDRFLN